MLSMKVYDRFGRCTSSEESTTAEDVLEAWDSIYNGAIRVYRGDGACFNTPFYNGVPDTIVEINSKDRLIAWLVS